MSGYCPAGKCECGNIKDDGGTIRCIAYVLTYTVGGSVISEFEVCPWPSRQVRVEPQKPDAVDAHNAGFAAGRSAGLREAVEAVKKIEGIPYKLGYEEKAWVERAEAIAAIRALVPHD
jgi:hypothetical protein